MQSTPSFAGLRGPSKAAVAAEADASPAATKQLAIGGVKTQALVSAFVAGASVFLLSALGQAIKTPLWAPPLGAVSLIFSADAVAQAKEGKIMASSQILDKALKAGSGVAGAVLLSVLITEVLGPSPLGRALVVGVCGLFMSLSPISAYFPPAAAFCALYVDQAIAGGPLAKMVYRYAFTPCFAGTALLLIFTRVITAAIAQPLRKFA